MTMETFPADGVANPSAYVDALQAFQPGDAATVFTPGTYTFFPNDWLTD